MAKGNDILVLLIGGNPLPNFATVKYLLKTERSDEEVLPIPNEIYLVYSEDTEKFVCKLCEGLGEEDKKKIKIQKVPLGETECMLCNEVMSKLDWKLSKGNINSLHLNYTGGTKPMVLGAYKSVQNTFCSKKIYTYTDPEEFNLHISDKDEAYPCADDLRDYVQPTIEQIYKLHNLGKISLKRENSPDFSKECQNKDFYRKILNKKNGNQDGKWLEELVFLKLTEIDKKFGLSDIAWNIEREEEKGKFEIDVIALRGYEPLVFSCTTSEDKKTIKLKAFEVNYRAVQLGGDYAKSIMVCLAKKEKCEKIKEDMQQFDAIRNFSIIGYDDFVGDKDSLKDAIIKKTKLGL